MSHAAVTFVTYLWHYLVTRLVYDQLVRPVTHGHVSMALLIFTVGAGAFLLGRFTAKPRERP